MPHLAPMYRPFALTALLGATLLVPSAAMADDGVILAQSPVHKLQVFADGGAGWCGAHLNLRMIVAPDSPDAGKPAAQVDMMNRLKQPLEAACAAATSADIAVVVGGRAQGSYHATKAGHWMFTTAAARQQPASLDAPNVHPVAAAPAAAAAAAPPPTQPGDVAGSHDPAFLKRYEGSNIVAYLTRPYDSYRIAAPDPKNPAAWGFAPVEGQITRIIYHVPDGHTVLELLRNYEHALTDAGLTQTAEYPPAANREFAYAVYHQGWQVQSGAEALWPQWGETWQQMAYVTSTGTAAGQDVKIAVLVANVNKPFDVNFGHGPIHITPESPVVVVDVVANKTVDINMVTVKASDIADALATKGTFDLYGILFDVDKTDIKPESAKSLDEVASLLKIDRSLKLEISGHTDNTGDKAHNLKLSEGRAQAVVDVLTKNYGIDPARLAAKGYGDTMPVAPNDSDANKAKNRRVELKKI